MKRIVSLILMVIVVSAALFASKSLEGFPNKKPVADSTTTTTAAAEKPEATEPTTAEPETESSSETTVAESTTAEETTTTVSNYGGISSTASGTSNGRNVKVAWKAVNGTAYYKVYRSTSPNGRFTYIGTSKDNVYVDKTAKAGVTYYYKIAPVKNTQTTAKPVTTTKVYRKPVTTTRKPVTTTKAPVTTATPVPSGAITGFEQEMLGYMNSYRKKHGVAPLSLSSELTGKARIRAKELTSNYSHTRPNGKNWYTVFDDLISPELTSWKDAAENIAWGQKNAKQASEEWYNSSSHRENILNPNFKYVGFGACANSKGRIYWDQLFLG